MNTERGERHVSRTFWRSLLLLGIALLMIPFLPLPAAGAVEPTITLPVEDDLFPSSRSWELQGFPLSIASGPTALIPAWTKVGENDDDFFGFPVATAGDVNGDGYADVLVGAYGFSAGNERGKVYLYLGSPSGLSTSPAWVAVGEDDGDRFGYSTAAAGDVNGDGYSDVLVGAYGFPNWTQRGKAYLYLGSSSGLSETPAWTATGENIGDLFGLRVAPAGDVNGDGYADVLIGAGHYPAGTERGKAYLYLGSSSGLASTPAWTMTGENPQDAYGWSASSAGDVNGDGYSDILIGAYRYPAGNEQGKVYLYLGSPSGPSETPDWTAAGESTGEWFGLSMTTAGDVNGDGYTDILIGAPAHPGGTWQGKTYLYLGSPFGPSSVPDWSTTGENGGDALGITALAGDVNGDGYADVLIGARGFSAGSGQGKVYLYPGSSSGLPSTPEWTATGEGVGDWLGYSISTAGDVNGDGYSDVLIGAPAYAGGNNRGKAYLYLGAASNPPSTPTWVVVGEGVGDMLGHSVALAGDVNGDGHSDLLVGAAGYPDGTEQGKAYLYLGISSGLPLTPTWSAAGENAGDRFAFSVAPAGDVNGDGYSDVLVGAPGYPTGTERGQVYLYLGSSSGLTSTLNWAAVGEYPGDLFGYSVFGVGDANGDGYGDVLIGAPGYPAGFEQGKVYLYFGSPSGLFPSPSWTTAGQNNGDRLGSTVAPAGDVNGDGYGDALIGAPGFPFSLRRGQVSLYLGSPSGFPSTPAWTATGQNNGDRFGEAVASAGDVNADGYADALVAAPGFPGGVERGRVYLYLGSASGLSPLPNWSATGENSGDALGRSISTAGDVHGDGYADVLVGAPGYPSGDGQGQVYLYPGMASGLSSSAGWSISGENAGDRLGNALAAGDTDGDGYADALIAAPAYPNGSGQGRTYLHLGNGGGRAVLARQSRGDGSGVPVSPWGLAHALDGFTIHAWATDPLGRGRVKLQWQVCPPGEPFTSTACLTSTSAVWTDVTTATTGVAFTETVAGLEKDTLYRWRVRVLYASQHIIEPGITPPPYPPHGPWRRFLAQTWEADLRTSPCSYSVTLTPTLDVRLGIPGSTVTYTLRLTNTGNCTDTFTVTISASWPVETPATVGPLEPGEAATVPVTVTIPIGTRNGDSDAAIVSFTSQHNPLVRGSSTLTTTVQAWQIYLPITFKGYLP